ncbi:MAG: PilZ domain-containing protein, partial [Candidatus Omnitrophota bacterium]
SRKTRMGYRWKVDMTLRYGLLESDQFQEAQLSDLSLRGVKFSPLNPLLVGEEIKLQINIPGDYGEINALGEVVWNSQIEGNSFCGILFTRIRDANRERILAYIERNFADKLRGEIWWRNTSNSDSQENSKIIERN